MRISSLICYVLSISLVLAACSNRTPESSLHLTTSTSEPSSIATSTLVATSSPTQPASTAAPSFSGTLAMAIVSRKHSGVVLFNLKNNSIEDLSNQGYGSVSWSPDGQWVAMSGGVPLSQRPPNIFLVKADGTERNRLTNSSDSEFDVNWSPDGKSIIYAHSSQGKPAELAAIEIETGMPFALTSTTGYEGFPTWSPDGKQVAYLYSENADTPLHLWLMDSNGKNAHLLLDMPVVFGKIDWSPRDPYIAFISSMTETDCGDIYVVKSDGSSPTRLADIPGCATAVTWSPDGNYLAFISKDANMEGNTFNASWQIYIIDKYGKNIVQVTDEKDWRIDDIDWSATELLNP